MLRNRKAKTLDLAILLILILTMNVFSLGMVLAQEDPVELWALLISGSADLDFSNNTQYMYHVLTDHYAFDGIYYLDVYTNRQGVNALSTKANVSWAITNWLANRADGNDIALVYFSSHGVGYAIVENRIVPGAHAEVGGDEGNEVPEVLLFSDINGNGDMLDWVSIDEGMELEAQNETYLDDELAADLNSVQGTVVFVRQGCFGGGLIDDLSNPNRIIMSATNETYYSLGNTDDPGEPGYGYSEWSEGFIDALHGERTYYDVATNTVVHTDIQIDADSDDNGDVTLWEAWEYAWNNDDARTTGRGTPWFDDDGDGLPTFTNMSDHLDQDGQSDLARQICLEPGLPRILNKLGFTNIAESTVEIFPPAHSANVTLYAELADFHDQNELSWYPAGTSEYHLIFSGPEGGDGFVNPPTSKTFVMSGEFGLSFLSPEARYYTQTSRNPDGLKHARVYMNLDNPDMYLIGFENLYGVGDEDYDDMVISLELINDHPNPPWQPDGPNFGYKNTWYNYSTNTTDPEGDNVCYEAEVTGYDRNTTTTTDWHQSGQTVTWSVLWESTDPPGYYYIRVRAKDVYGAWSDWSPPLTVTIANRSPNTPSTPSGGYIAYVGESYLFGTIATDLDGDNVCYEFDWGDNSTHTITGWYTSNQSAYASHIWTATGTFHVKVKAKDIWNVTSAWSASHPVTVYNGSGGGGDPCPVLFVWNGDDYVDYGVVDIHNPSGEDVIKEVPVNVEDVGINNYQAVFRLREGWEGLNFSESVIDQVKLYAVDNYGNRYLCPLISATHCTFGNVWLKLLFSDEWKTHLLLLETIQLTFLMPYPNVQSYVFIVEGCNQIKL